MTTNFIPTMSQDEQAAILRPLFPESARIQSSYAVARRVGDELIVDVPTIHAYIEYPIEQGEQSRVYRVENVRVEPTESGYVVAEVVYSITYREWTVEAEVVTAYTRKGWGRMVTFTLPNGATVEADVDGMLQKQVKRELVRRAKANRVKATMTLLQKTDARWPTIIAYTLTSGKTAEQQLFEQDMAEYRTMLVAEQVIAGEGK